MSRRSSFVTVQKVGEEWMVVQHLTAEDARSTAYAFGTRDGVFMELMNAADEVDHKNGDSDDS